MNGRGGRCRCLKLQTRKAISERPHCLGLGTWRVGENDSESKFGHQLPNFNGVSETEAKTWLREGGFSSIRSWQHLFAAHPYGRVTQLAKLPHLLRVFRQSE